MINIDASRECVGRIEGIELICQILSDECNASWPIDIIYWCCRFLACGCLRSETNARAAFHSHIIPVLMRLTSHPHASVVTSSIFAIDRIAQHSGLSPSRNLQYIFSSHGVSGKGVFVFLEERFVSN
eukprot:TRINITY_DN5908_c0_g1_i5.p2 TRINITY_DN5908_c0_g1~~TRINITY_DN5908_c0_g1_i5.p2  ORF type:complete len:127 (-),score=17.68 TRINITY_DN5908_c0_g1_i5:1587-1967(-)